MLLAEGGETTTFFGVLGTAIGSLGLFGVAYLAYRTSSDRLKHDTRMLEMEAKLATTRAAFEECDRERKNDRAELAELHGKYDAVQLAHARLEGEQAATNRKLSSVRQVVDDLRGGREQQGSTTTPPEEVGP